MNCCQPASVVVGSPGRPDRGRRSCRLRELPAVRAARHHFFASSRASKTPEVITSAGGGRPGPHLMPVEAAVPGDVPVLPAGMASRWLPPRPGRLSSGSADLRCRLGALLCLVQQGRQRRPERSWPQWPGPGRGGPASAEGGPVPIRQRARGGPQVRPRRQDPAAEVVADPDRRDVIRVVVDFLSGRCWRRRMQVLRLTTHEHIP
jgi:hypothetical protein